MSPSAAPTVSHDVDIQRSRQLVHDSRALIASVKELIAQSRQSIARQRYFKIVCAWCQQTIRWQRTEGAAPGQISHSICFACFAGVFRELDPVHPLPQGSTQVDEGHARAQHSCQR